MVRDDVYRLHPATRPLVRKFRIPTIVSHRDARLGVGSICLLLIVCHQPQEVSARAGANEEEEPCRIQGVYYL